MKFGMPTLVECSGIDECIKVAKDCHLDFIEINMSFPEYQTSSLDIEHLKNEIAHSGLFFPIHADEQLNPFDFNKEVSECYFSVMRKTILFAKELGIPLINMHLLKGVYVTLPDRVILLSDVYRLAYLGRVREFIAMCEEEIGDAPLKIAIENVDTNPFTEGQKEALALFLASDKFALTLDTGHEMCLNYKDTSIFEKYPEKLWHMHLHDSNGKHAHLPLGTANLVVGETLSRLREGETCLIEVKTVAGLKESISYLKQLGIFSK